MESLSHTLGVPSDIIPSPQVSIAINEFDISSNTKSLSSVYMIKT